MSGENTPPDWIVKIPFCLLLFSRDRQYAPNVRYSCSFYHSSKNNWTYQKIKVVRLSIDLSTAKMLTFKSRQRPPGGVPLIPARVMYC